MGLKVPVLESRTSLIFAKGPSIHLEANVHKPSSVAEIGKRGHMCLTISAMGTQNKVQITPDEKYAFYRLMTTIFSAVCLSSFVHKHRTIPAGFHNSVCDLSFMLNLYYLWENHNKE